MYWLAVGGVPYILINYSGCELDTVRGVKRWWWRKNSGIVKTVNRCLLLNSALTIGGGEALEPETGNSRK